MRQRTHWRVLELVLRNVSGGTFATVTDYLWLELWQPRYELEFTKRGVSEQGGDDQTNLSLG